MLPIDLAAAVRERESEIVRLRALEPKIRKLIDDSAAAERGQTCMPDKEWRALREEVEREMWDLGLIRQAQAMGYITIVVGKPSHWSNAELVPPEEPKSRKRKGGRQT